jgi:hypothetical protein
MKLIRLEALWRTLKDWWTDLGCNRPGPEISREMLDPDPAREPSDINPTTLLPMYDEDMDVSMTLYGFEEDDN